MSATYSYDRRNAAVRSGTYSDNLIKIVRVVDDLDRAAKHLPAAASALVELYAAIREDQAVTGLPGLDKYAPEQQLDYLAKALDRVRQSIPALTEAYDDANRVFTSLKLK
jgi:ABC-type transporter Mla subunit MlaD